MLVAHVLAVFLIVVMIGAGGITANLIVGPFMRASWTIERRRRFWRGYVAVVGLVALAGVLVAVLTA